MRFRDLPCNSEGVYRLEFNYPHSFPAQIHAYYIVNMQILQAASQACSSHLR